MVAQSRRTRTANVTVGFRQLLKSPERPERPEWPSPRVHSTTSRSPARPVARPFSRPATRPPVRSGVRRGRAFTDHMENERALLDALEPREAAQLERLLTTWLAKVEPARGGE